MKVSVIVPVFSAELYLRQAVFSALQQPETAEILLVEDGSPDGCLAICHRLQQEHASVRVLRHPNGQNHGPSASRNLGIREAVFPFIAFLDADDFYLPGRFSLARQLFELHEEADGVYEATGVQPYGKTQAYKMPSSLAKEKPFFRIDRSPSRNAQYSQ
jgi:glycosyltransferase involved in cell wall biosynthesis